MDKLFLHVLNMSVTASYVILFVILARIFLKKVPKIFSYALWSVVLFRLVCPFSFESIFSLLPLKTQAVTQNVLSSSAKIDSGITAIDQVINRTFPVSTVQAVGANSFQTWLVFDKILWLLGILILLMYSIFTYIKLSRKLKSGTLVCDNIYQVNNIKTPFVFGLIRPKIYLPTNLSELEQSYIVKHEQTHIKRLDHIIKPFAFLVLCIHWFNPLVWISFFLMSEDMELSCDESVIKQMGNSIKKDYSTSLLSLSTGRRIIGGCPLAFGENNTKGRIMNILNYKKPKFWIVFVTVIALASISLGLMSNPQSENLTIEAYANQFINEIKKNYTSADFKIVDSKITKLERIASVDGIISTPLEIWHLEYLLKPNDISKIMLAGGANEIDGWITEESSMGKPMLIFSYAGSKPVFLGHMWSAEGDFSTISGYETALRIFLEGKKMLPNETFKGNHVIVKFPLSTGETSQLFLSQPAVQGNNGIWCVERWMDGTGNLYYYTPKTDSRISDYYKELQKQSDDGHITSLLNPLQVAFDYINNELGQNVQTDKLVIQYSASVEDFMKTPESHFIGYISNFNVDTSSFYLDKIEWLTLDDTERLNQLNIDPNDMANGFYIHNPDSYPMHCMITTRTQYTVINRDGEATHKPVTIQEFIKYLEQFTDFTPPFRVITKDGYVQSVIEQYVP